MALTGLSRLPRLVLGSLPWRVLVLDLVVIVAWVGVVTFAFEGAGWPIWLYYAVIFSGVIMYSVGIGPLLSRRGS
ncbi:MULTISPECIES: hypothetical protein [Halostella]|uniref:hypothetical protein n=1 Tax=Halostella TaxID=1843185 RepID=UPI00108190EF|nr:MULTISPECIES: hypothetical protein [Halostella]